MIYKLEKRFITEHGFNKIEYNFHIIGAWKYVFPDEVTVFVLRDEPGDEYIVTDTFSFEGENLDEEKILKLIGLQTMAQKSFNF